MLHLLYLPDVDKWERMSTPIETLLGLVDYAFIDGTFFTEQELPGRNMDDIPHPSIQESLQRFSTLPTAERHKIHFIHFNHTNPVLQPNSRATAQILDAGMHVAAEHMRQSL